MTSNRNSAKKSTQTHPHKHDALLEEFLPVIHNAAYSIQKDRKRKEAPIDIVLAGLRGLKEVLLQFNETKHHCEPQTILLDAIHCSIMNQIKIK